MDKVIKNKRVNSRSSGYKTNFEKLFYYLYIIWPCLIV